MSKLTKQLELIEAKKKALELEEKQLIEVRKSEISTLIEKIPGALSQDNIILAGIIADGLAKLEQNPSLEDTYKDAAYNLPSFRKPKLKTTSTDKISLADNE